MKKFVALTAGLALALGAMAADKPQAKPAAVKLTEAQMAKTTAGRGGSPGLFFNGNGDVKVASSCNFSMKGNGSWWWFCV